MMELLKKFEEESINDASDEDDDVLGADLAKRLQGVDLGQYPLRLKMQGTSFNIRDCQSR